MRLRLSSLRKFVFGAALYAVLWLVTATLGVRMVEARVVHTYPSLTKLETSAPFPFVVRISFVVEDMMSMHGFESTYLWLGRSLCVHESVGRACKWF